MKKQTETLRSLREKYNKSVTAANERLRKIQSEGLDSPFVDGETNRIYSLFEQGRLRGERVYRRLFSDSPLTKSNDPGAVWAFSTSTRGVTKKQLEKELHQIDVFLKSTPLKDLREKAREERKVRDAIFEEIDVEPGSSPGGVPIKEDPYAFERALQDMLYRLAEYLISPNEDEGAATDYIFRIGYDMYGRALQKGEKISLEEIEQAVKDQYERIQRREAKKREILRGSPLEQFGGGWDV